MTALDIRIRWSAGTIDDVQVDSRRPRPSQALRSLRPDEALAVLGRLYGVCGRAQTACAEFALAAAAGAAPAPERRAILAREVAAEAVQEQLWRLLLDWPKALGLDPLQAELKRWYGRAAIRDDGWARGLLEVLEREWLGRPIETLDSWDLVDFDAWAAAGATSFARLFGRLRAAAATDGPSCALLVEESESAVAAAADHPWIASLLAAGRALEAHVCARLVALTTTLRAADAVECVEMDAEAPAPGRGVALVTTARGMLEHEVVLDGGRIARYEIRTPTDSNFAVDGAYVRRVLGRRAADPAAALETARRWALAFDPCVAYDVRLGGVGHA